MACSLMTCGPYLSPRRSTSREINEAATSREALVESAWHHREAAFRPRRLTSSTSPLARIFVELTDGCTWAPARGCAPTRTWPSPGSLSVRLGARPQSKGAAVQTHIFRRPRPQAWEPRGDARRPQVCRPGAILSGRNSHRADPTCGYQTRGDARQVTDSVLGCPRPEGWP